MSKNIGEEKAPPQIMLYETNKNHVNCKQNKTLKLKTRIHKNTLENKKIYTLIWNQDHMNLLKIT